MSLSAFKLNQIKTGHSCLFIGLTETSLASTLVQKKVDLGMNQGILFTTNHNQYNFDHKLEVQTSIGKKIIKSFHQLQKNNHDKKILVIDNVNIKSLRLIELVNLLSDKEAMSKTLVIFVFDRIEDVPDDLKDYCSHIFRLNDKCQIVVETDNKLYHL